MHTLFSPVSGAEDASVRDFDAWVINASVMTVAIIIPATHGSTMLNTLSTSYHLPEIVSSSEDTLRSIFLAFFAEARRSYSAIATVSFVSPVHAL